VRFPERRAAKPIASSRWVEAGHGMGEGRLWTDSVRHCILEAAEAVQGRSPGEERRTIRFPRKKEEKFFHFVRKTLLNGEPSHPQTCRKWGKWTRFEWQPDCMRVLRLQTRLLYFARRAPQ
jgi:hypothetical protein